MMNILDASADGFEVAFANLLSSKRDQQQDVRHVVSDIIGNVRQRGDAALVDYTSRFDRLEVTPHSLQIPQADIDAARCSPELEAALQLAAGRIRSYHEMQLPEDYRYIDDTGMMLGWKWTPVDAAGIYVPGGKAAYPSSVLMNAVAAKVAGVKRIVMTVPTPDGVVNPALLVAARIASIDAVYRIGGAQAIAALAYGTESITPVSVIVGPGNAYVAEAKRQVFGTVGIDMVAGPSEILVVSDRNSNPDWIAADLLSQAEHGSDSQSILITDDAGFAAQVKEAVASQLAQLPRKDMASESISHYSAIIVVPSLDAAVPLIDRIAPEHLELAVDDPEALAERITHAGAIFLGRYTPEALGDYLAGPNHVLPTSTTARFSSGLSVLHFMKRTSLMQANETAIRALREPAITLAEAEGLDAHAASLKFRRNV